jgi:CRP-like cAMP-binding protein
MSERPTNAFLRALRPESYDQLAAELAPVELRLGDVLYRPGDRVDWIVFPLNSMVSVLASTHRGEQVETAVVGNEGALGLVEALGAGTSFMSSVVQVDGRALRIAAGAFRRLVAADEDLNQLCWRLVELHVSESRQSGLCQALHPVDPRMARWLLECAERCGGRDVLPVTQEFLASMLGVQRTTVTAFAAQQQKAGLIRYARGKIEILDTAAMEARACECREATREQRARLGFTPLPVGRAALRLVAG